MSATVLYMSMSLDGFIAGPNEGPDNGLGDGGHRLHEWFLPGADAEPVVRSLVGPGDESVEGHGHVENGCGHGVSFSGSRLYP